ncbi:MAG: HEAT repeat domain-containing protein [Verrucomicrobiaceae bacterium]|nr:HEAT repeat domain-containing protein [Verrucomicrobiaceae bacterium]
MAHLPYQTAVLLLTFVLALCQAGRLFGQTPPDLTNGGVPSSNININLGPTGLRGWVYHASWNTSLSRQIQVQVVEAGSPAAGVLEVNDVILGADGSGAEPVGFSADARKSLADAINDAEARSPATLKLLRWRAGVTSTVTLTLRTMGAYSATAPYACPKSALILEEGLQAIMAGETAGRYSFGTLALLAGNDPNNPLNAARQTRAQTEARAMILNAATLAKLTSGEPDMEGSATWKWGHQLIVLTEYYLQTQDAQVLPSIDAITQVIVNGLNVFGTSGHKFSPRWRDGTLNGPQRTGYGTVNSASMPCVLGLLLAKECGVVNAGLDPMIARATCFLAYYAGKGAIPYGEHDPYWQGHDNNGKSGLAALCFERQTSRVAQQKMFAKMAVAATSEREVGHTGAFFNYLWSPLGAAAGGEQAAASYFSRVRWMLDLNRRWDGSFVYDCLNGEGPNNGATYNDFRMSTASLLVYALPLRQLRITGLGRTTARDLSSTDIAEAEAVDGYNADLRSTSQLMSDLGSWSPRVQRSAAVDLGTRTTETAALLPTLHTMATDAQSGSRVGACFAIGHIANSSSAPVLAALLTDPVNHVRYAAAEALRYLPQAARTAQLNTILAVTASTATPLFPLNEEDPLHMAHGRLAMLLFYSGSAYGPKGIIWNNLTGVNRSLLYPAIRAVAANPIGICRSTLSTTYQNLTSTDYLALADTVVTSAYEISPADKMFSGGDRNGALIALEKFKAAEGVPLSVLTIEDDVGLNDQALAVLERYAGGAKTVHPNPGVEAAMNFLIQTGVNAAEAQAVLAAIASDPTPATLAPLKSIQSVTADTPALTSPAKWTMQRVTSQDLAKGDSIYTWRKVHGAGSVSFTPNGNAAAKDTTVLFDGTPGQYLFEVKMSDSKNLTEVFSTVAVTLNDTGGTLPPNSPPVAHALSPSIPQAAATPITLTGSDPESRPLNFRLTSQPTNGTLTGTAPYLVYTSAFNFTGADSFAFEAQDSEGQTATATISITVVPATAHPVAVYEPFDYATGGLSGKSGSSEVGLSGTWTANASAQLQSGSLTHGTLPVKGNSIACTGASNNFGGARSISPAALAANGLLNDGATLWFSAVVGTASTLNMTNMRLCVALANSQFSGGNFQYHIINEGPQLGSGIGFTFGRLNDGVSTVNGKVCATQFRDSTFGTSGFSGNVLGTVPPSFLTAGQRRLIVGKITWGATSDTIELYEPDTSLALGNPTSTLTVNVNQSTFDTLTFSRGEAITLDEIRFGGNYHSVLIGSAAMTADTTPPVPNPPSFHTPPVVTDASSITMTAATAFDPNGVQYFFTCTSGSGHHSGWQSSPSYTDTGLTPGTYSYTVSTRDLSPAQNLSTTSAAASATISAVPAVPSVALMLQSTGQSVLTSAGFTIGSVQPGYSATVPHGLIISQTPAGEQNAGWGSSVNLTVSAYFPPTFASWQSINAASGGATGDHDHDGVPNGIEYFLTGPYLNPNGLTQLPAIAHQSGTLSITWPKGPDYTGTYGTDFIIESSDTLIGAWTPETIGGNVILSGNNFIYTFPASTRRFVRLKVMGP